MSREDRKIQWRYKTVNLALPVLTGGADKRNTLGSAGRKSRHLTVWSMWMLIAIVEGQYIGRR